MSSNNPASLSVNPTVALVTVMFNSDQCVRKLLHSISISHTTFDEIIVVDNGVSPTDFSDLPKDIRIVRSGPPENVSRARNRGWKEAHSQIVFFCDDDNTIEAGMLEALLVHFASAEIAAVSPIALVRDTDDIWCAGVTRNSWTGQTRYISDISMLPVSRYWETDDLPNAFCIRRSVLERLGGFDDYAFPITREEADLACRTKDLGFRTIVAADAYIRHHIRHNDRSVQTLAGEIARMVERGGFPRLRLHCRNRVLFHRRHSTGIRKLFILTVAIPAWALLLTIVLLRINQSFKWKLKVSRTIAGGLTSGYFFHFPAPRYTGSFAL